MSSSNCFFCSVMEKFIKKGLVSTEENDHKILRRLKQKVIENEKTQKKALFDEALKNVNIKYDPTKYNVGSYCAVVVDGHLFQFKMKKPCVWMEYLTLEGMKYHAKKRVNDSMQIVIGP